MVKWRIDYKSVQIQVCLQILPVETAVCIQEHFQQTVNAIYRVERVFAVGQTAQIRSLVSFAFEVKCGNKFSMCLLLVVNQNLYSTIYHLRKRVCKCEI